MTTYSLADAESDLPRLIERALEGEEVVITRQGEPVVALKPLIRADQSGSVGSYAWLRARRRNRKGIGLTSVDLLNLMYDDTAA